MLTSSQKSQAREQIMSHLISLIHKQTRTAVLFVQTVSKITGINPTDIKCLDFLSEVHSATAGDLAKVTGLTTGAVTSVIDRLENAGFVKREADSNDRRKIIIRLTAEHPNNLKLVHDLFANQIPNVLSGYKTDELKLIADWNAKMTAAFLDEIEKLRNY